MGGSGLCYCNFNQRKQTCVSEEQLSDLYQHCHLLPCSWSVTGKLKWPRKTKLKPAGRMLARHSACSGSDPGSGCNIPPCLPPLRSNSHSVTFQHALLSLPFSGQLYCKTCLFQLSYFYQFSVSSLCSFICYPCFFHSFE